MRTLSLKRERVSELTTDDLQAVVGGGTETLYSCLDYISCHIVSCGLLCVEG